ncbi:MAG: class I SAM-dependent methyltransferase [Pseudomonas sp.]|uniref:class I SAM-dependent methyltransferase n=1 Tax=Pseudomonas abieticivorans TaxID=2931382 RepID=UPI0020BFC438|nr:class I SAM-dependent methyltransferase [Pseudomonas sp. PIA16]MDE1164221.1 class I SAM-dependent methyltransferase [Pseudomonas sp.]
MNIKISGGEQEDGIVVGNTYDKYGARNPIVKWIMNGFESALSELVSQASPSSIHEVGCGEGYWVLQWTDKGLSARGCDFSSQVIEMARENSAQRGLSDTLFEVRSVYDLQAPRDCAELIVCCEVLEHLEDPELALAALQRVVTKNLIISVPREPLWCALNLARGKYVFSGGNTPGHIQHWSKAAFVRLVSKYFDVQVVKSPLPWTMLLCRLKP